MSTIASYRVIRQLGGGTFGRVKRKIYTVARHNITSALVAIKVLNKAEIRSKNLYHKVKREVKILKSFHHPNIIRLYDIIESTTSLLIVMEFLPGGELYNIIEQHRLTEDSARLYFTQILAGLEYVHQKGYAHRDIKPENLMLDIDGKVKIGDFGLSNSLKSGEFLKTQCGSPNYAAPEVISGEKYCGTQVDIWSLGVVLYALIARELPFDDTSIPALFSRIKLGQFKFKPHFSDSLKDLILRMLTVDPIARITIPQIRNHPWLKACPYYEINLITQEKIVKMYNNKDLYEKVLKNTIEYPEFKNISLDYAASVIVNRQKNDMPEEECELSTTYNILLDIELYSQKKLIEISQSSMKTLLKPNCLGIMSEKTTARSSYTDDAIEKSPPYNWVYGFRSNLQYCYLAYKLFDSFKETGLSWKIHSKSHILLKGHGVKLQFVMYKFKDTIVIDSALIKGSVMKYFDIVKMVYTIIYKFTHI